MRNSWLLSIVSGLTLLLASPAFAATTTAAVTPACTSGSRILNNRACWVSCGITRPGGNYKQSQTKSLDACIQLCAADAQCTTAQYREDNLFCYMKNVRNSAATSTVADTVDCDVDYTPTASNCPVGKNYKVRSAGTNSYAATGTSGTSNLPPEFVLNSGTIKTLGSTYQFFIDAKGACGFRLLNGPAGWFAFLPSTSPPTSEDTYAVYIRFDAPNYGSSVQPLSCIKGANSMLDCHLESNVAWDKLSLFDYNSNNLVCLSTPVHGDAVPAVLDAPLNLVLEEV